MIKSSGKLIHVALYKPEIPPNTGNIARLCAANGLPLHLVGRLGFRIDERSIRRAGLDYWPHVDLHQEKTLAELRAKLPDSRFFYLSTRADRLYTEVEYQPGDCVVFGSESRGLGDAILQEDWGRALRIPMLSPNVRSLNLSAAVAIVVYEALRQISYSSPAHGLCTIEEG